MVSSKPIYCDNHSTGRYAKDKDTFSNTNKTLYGRHEKTSRNTRIFVVYSYGGHWLLYVFDYETDRWYENSDSSTRTTNQHRSQARPTSNTLCFSKGEMRTIVRSGYVGLTQARIGG